MAKLTGHTNLIYDMCWLNYLASASADCSVCLWKVNETSHIMVQKIMHSSFIYTVKVCPHNQNILATGGYDKSVRIWLNDEEKANNVDFKLHQELDGHDGFINTICFVSNSDTFYTGDSNGLIIKWNSDEGTWYNVQ